MKTIFLFNWPDLSLSFILRRNHGVFYNYGMDEINSLGHINL